MFTPVETWLLEAKEHRVRTGRPYVTLSWAQSIDGSISTRREAALPISGKASLQMTHELRTVHEAITVGIGTILADDPLLTVRLVEGKDPQAVILDSHLDFPVQARLLENPAPPWIATLNSADREKEAYLTSRGVRVLRLPPDATGRVDLFAFLDRLATYDINSVLVEGGARVITSFLVCQLVDRVVVTISPIFVGGLHVLEGLLSPMPRLKEVGSARLGEDLIVWGAPEW